MQEVALAVKPPLRGLKQERIFSQPMFQMPKEPVHRDYATDELSSIFNTTENMPRIINGVEHAVRPAITVKHELFWWTVDEGEQGLVPRLRIEDDFVLTSPVELA